MKKRVLIFAVLLCTVISLCACSGKQNRNTENSGSTSGSAAETDSRASSEKPDIPDSSPGQSSASDISDAQKSRTPESSVSESGTSESDASGGKESSAGGTSLPETGRDTDHDDPYSSEAEQSAPSGLPDGLKRASDTKLTFTSSVLSLSATFSDEFCVLNRDYTPKYGIYLQNKQGTATLLAESVEDTTLTYRQMTEYLKSRYPEARIYTTDQKDVVCKTTATDQNGNEICVFERIKMQTGGYNLIAVCCRPEDKAVFEKLFNETSFS